MDISELYQDVFKMCIEFSAYQKNNVRENVKNILPVLGEFSEIILREHGLEIDAEDYRYLHESWVGILEDIASGMKENDRILLEDTVEYGLKAFLELFFEEQEVRKLREECANGLQNV